MSVIERWTFNACPVCGAIQHFGGEYCYGLTTERHQRAKVKAVEFVPAEQLRGAVDLLEQAVSLIAQPSITPTARARWQAAVDEMLGDGSGGQ
jgi:hypothetical protein